MKRIRFLPDSTKYGPGPYPTVLMVPPTVFHQDVDDHGNGSERVATADLQDAGFMVFQVDTRVADQMIQGQVTSGTFPAPTDDLKRQILAALADPQCNGTIYLVGGSSGGCLSLWVMLDSSAGAVSATGATWNETARTSIKAVVSLSGPTNLNDYSNPGGVDITEFANSADYYLGLPLGVYDGTLMYNASPVSLVITATSSPPVLLYATKGDTVPYSQSTDMKTALSKFPALEVDQYTMDYTAPGTNHAFHYWHEINTLTGNCVSSEVIAFLHKYP